MLTSRVAHLTLSRSRWLVVLTLLAFATSSRPAEPASPSVSWGGDGAVTGAALAVWGASELAKGSLAPISCRWCSADGVDTTVRDAVVWSDRRTAATLSDVLQFAVPLGVAAYDVLATPASGPPEEAMKDVLLVAETVAIAGVLTQTAKYSFARIRPYAYQAHTDAARDDHTSFWSGHTVVTFAAASAGGTVARMRGDAAWPWVYAAGFTGAALTGYLRMAGDKHWLTDVLASAAVGTGTGILVPWLHRARSTAVTPRLVPLPGGIAVAGEF